MALLTKTQLQGMMKSPSFTINNNEKEAISQLASTLFHSITQSHVLHLKAINQSYPLHKALEEYYNGLPDLIDSIVEKWQGKYGIVDNYTTKPISCCVDSSEHITTVAEEVTNIRSKFSDGYIQQEVDNILAHIYQTLYRINNLKT